MSYALPTGYSARPPTPEDAAAIAAVLTAAQQAYGDPSEIDADEIIADWDGLDLATEALVIVDASDDIVASADIDNRGNSVVAVYGYVHPEHQGRGLGTALVRWGEQFAEAHLDQAPEGVRVVTQHYIPTENRAGIALIEALAYQPERTVYKMSITLDEPPALPDAIDGIEMRAFVPGQDEEGTHATVEEAFVDLWGRPPMTLEDWLGFHETARTMPDLWLLAVERESGRIIGTSLGTIGTGTGWISSVAVRPEWRQRGIAGALLVYSFRAFLQRGVREIGLSVDADSRTGAPRVYLRAGMHVAESYTVYRKTIRDGVDGG